MARTRWLQACAVAALSLGCADGAGGDLSSTSRQSIVLGEPSGSDQDGVVLLRAPVEGGSELLCTASLVGPNLLLTAQHCVTYLSEGLFSCSVRGELIDNPEGGGRLGLPLPATSLEVYSRKTPRKTPLAHGQQIISTLSPTICTNDIAFIVLDTALDLPVVPMRLGRPALAGEVTTLVGFGLDGTMTSIDYRTQPRRQKRDLDIVEVGPDSSADGVTTVPPRTVILKGPSGCIGDSGGPLLSQKTGAVLGVYSLQKGEGCVAPEIRHQMVHVPAFGTLVSEAFAAANCEPTLEPDDSPSDGSGGAGGDAGAAAGAAAGAGAGGATGAATGAGGATDAAGEPTTAGSAPTNSRDSSSCAFGLALPRLPNSVLLALLALAALKRRVKARAGA